MVTRGNIPWSNCDNDSKAENKGQRTKSAFIGVNNNKVTSSKLPYPLTSFPRHLLCVPDTDDVKQKKKNDLLLLNEPQKKKHTKKNTGYDEQGSIADE